MQNRCSSSLQVFGAIAVITTECTAPGAHQLGAALLTACKMGITHTSQEHLSFGELAEDFAVPMRNSI